MDLLFILFGFVTLIRVLRLVALYVLYRLKDIMYIDSVDKFEALKSVKYSRGGHTFFIEDDDLKICLQNYQKYVDFIRSFNPNIGVLCDRVIFQIYGSLRLNYNGISIPWSMLLPQNIMNFFIKLMSINL